MTSQLLTESKNIHHESKQARTLVTWHLLEYSMDACKYAATYVHTLKLAGKVTCKSNFFKIRCHMPFHYLWLKTKTYFMCAHDSNNFTYARFCD